MRKTNYSIGEPSKIYLYNLALTTLSTINCSKKKKRQLFENTGKLGDKLRKLFKDQEVREAIINSPNLIKKDYTGDYDRKTHALVLYTVMRLTKFYGGSPPLRTVFGRFVRGENKLWIEDSINSKTGC